MRTEVIDQEPITGLLLKKEVSSFFSFAYMMQIKGKKCSGVGTANSISLTMSSPTERTGIGPFKWGECFKLYYVHYKFGKW